MQKKFNFCVCKKSEPNFYKLHRNFTTNNPRLENMILKINYIVII